MQRRDLLKLLVGTAALQLTAAEPGAPLYFSKPEFAALDDLTEIIIPADDHSPGARDAQVAAYIDKTVAEAFLPEDKTSWRKGLSPFVPLNKAQRVTLLTELAAKNDPFFQQLKESTAYAYYTSKIGIHQDIQYLGNVIQIEFAGYDAT